MFNFILGFISGVYVGTYNHSTCRPCLERFTDCFKKEFDRITTNLDNKTSEDNNNNENKDK
jgi:hypothetical protein